MVSKIDHLGIAVHSIAAARVFYEQVLGLVCHGIEEVETQKVRTAFFTVGDIHIELLEPTAPDSPVARFLEKHGEGFHHIGYLSDRIEDEMARARDAGLPADQHLAGGRGRGQNGSPSSTPGPPMGS